MERPPKLPLDENLLKALGTFVARFSLLELEIHYLVWRLLDPLLQGLGKRVTNAVSFHVLRRMLGTLFKYRTYDEVLWERMTKLVKKLDKAYYTRNDVLHSFWVNRPGLEEALVIRMQAKPKGFREELLDHDIEKLYAKAEEFTSLHLEVQELHYAIYNATPSLRIELAH